MSVDFEYQGEKGREFIPGESPRSSYSTLEVPVRTVKGEGTDCIGKVVVRIIQNKRFREELRGGGVVMRTRSTSI